LQETGNYLFLFFTNTLTQLLLMSSCYNTFSTEF